MDAFPTPVKAFAVAALLAGSAMTPAFAQTAPTPPAAAQPAAPKPEADMGEVLATLAGLEPKPIESLEPSEARKQPTPTDAFADMGNLRLRW